MPSVLLSLNFHENYFCLQFYFISCPHGSLIFVLFICFLYISVSFLCFSFSLKRKFFLLKRIQVKSTYSYRTDKKFVRTDVTWNENCNHPLIMVSDLDCRVAFGQYFLFKSLKHLFTITSTSLFFNLHINNSYIIF